MSNVVTFAPKPVSKPAYAVTQEQLLEERMLMRRAQEAVKQWKEKRAWIQGQVASEQIIEPGPLVAELRTRSRRRGRDSTVLCISIG
jgi:hypothetical protein